MRTTNIKQYINGWIIGDFEPTLLKTSGFEVAHHFYKKGCDTVKHTHKIATECNYVISGELIASGKLLSDGDIFVYEPGEVSDVSFVKDTNLIVIKTPSIPSDKYIV